MLKKGKEFMKMEREELRFMKKKGAPKKMVQHEKREIATYAKKARGGKAKKG